MSEQEKYAFSFTASNMRLNDSLKIAEFIVDNEGCDWHNNVNQEEILGLGNLRTSKREFRELLKRLNKLTPDELQLFIKGDLLAQKQIAFLSICKTYGFICDFVLEVIRDKFLVFDYQINEGDYSSYFSRKIELHPEMDELAETTVKKVRQVTFKILEQTGIIDDVNIKMIQPQLLSDDVIRVIVDDNQEWLKIFLMSDKDIESATV